MEKILVLNGSPRGQSGNTQILVDLFIEGYRSANNQVAVKQVALKQADIKSCQGCFACWTESPGKCVLKDDMTLLFQAYIEADLIVWATPLYHYGMTSIMKKFVERTLPLSQPQIKKNDNNYTHPNRFNLNQKHVLISNCGFPERQNFNVMTQSFERITSGPITSILCVMGEILSEKALRSRFTWYLNAVKKAGEELALNREISAATSEVLAQSLLPIEEYVDMANISWDINNAHSEPSELIENQNNQKAYQFLKLMNYSFNPDAAKGLEAVLEMTFTDSHETCQFHIKDQKSHLIEGSPKTFTTKIITTYDTWLDISEGRLDGPEAMMKGLYKVKGDLNLLMKLSYLYGEGIEKISKPLENKKILGLARSKWMAVTFIPWSFSWIFLSKNIVLGVWLPIVMMLGILMVKGRAKSVTYFEQSSTLYFAVIAILTLFGLEIPRSQAILLNYFVIAAIWGFSVLAAKALTSEYSLYDQKEDLSNNIIFNKTNDHLTIFWAAIFLIQGFFHYNLDAMNILILQPLVYILLLVAGKFTQWYSHWYPKKIIRG